MSRRNDLIELCGDMWNELENLRDLWTGTDREVHCLMLIEEYESITGLAAGSSQEADQ